MNSHKNTDPRNNTSFIIKITTLIEDLKKRYNEGENGEKHSKIKWNKILKNYQYIIRTLFTEYEFSEHYRGLLIYHTMGMGKTRLAVSIAMSLWDKRTPVFISRRSLRANFINTIKEVCNMTGINTEKAIDRFIYISLDAYNMIDQIKRQVESLDNKLIIIDEAHNLFRSIINGSKNSVSLYEMIMEADNLRIIFLTGTPLTKDPFELVPCMNMLTKETLLPAYYNKFYELYVNLIEMSVENKDRLANRLLGLVSYISFDENSDKKPRDDNWFPEKLPMIISKVEMSKMQYRKYLAEREREEKSTGKRFIEKEVPMRLPSSEKKAMSSYYVKSRLTSNYFQSEKILNISNVTKNDLTKEHSPKMALIAERVKKAVGPVLIYSQFVDLGGLKILSMFLEQVIEKRFVRIISGEISHKERDDIQKEFNGSNNIKGDIIKALLISETGAEGLNLKNIREVHILEPYWYKSREDQVIYRAIRLGSHNMLPKDQRDVQSYLYIAMANIETWESIAPEHREQRTIDEMFHERAEKKYKIINNFRTMLKEVCVECKAFGYPNCHVCVPDGNTLFIMDPVEDLKLPDPCVPYDTEEIDVEEIDYNGEKYYYKKDESAVFNYRIYQFDKTLDNYVELPENEDLYSEIVDFINIK